MTNRAKAAKKSGILLSALDEGVKNRALDAIAAALLAQSGEIFAANEKDLAAGESLAAPLKKRLVFDEKKLSDCVQGIRDLIELEDPVGKYTLVTELDDNLTLRRVTCPIGVIGMIFESRPDALVQIATLCLKSGNAALLKGGSEASHTNRALYQVIYTAGLSAGLPENWLTLLESRDDVSALLKEDKYVDLIIPRGSNEFVRYIMDNSAIPVMGHADGICHAYVDEDADLGKAVQVCYDAKVQYVAACNAIETLLVHEAVAADFLPLMAKEYEKAGVKIYGDARTREYIAAEPATEADWDTEYLELVISVKVVDSVDEAIEHINTHGSGHTDTILSRNRETVEYFMQLVDSADVFANCSTRFADGYRFGFGAEVGISTAKIHARGPVGLEGLLIYKYRLYGDGQVVADYASGKASFKHRRIL